MGNNTWFILLALAIILAVSFSITYPVQVIGAEESGSGKSMNYSISYNCPEKFVEVRLTGDAGPLADATTYLFYVDYTYLLISKQVSDKSGYAKLRVVGKDELLNKMFVLRVDRPLYKTMQVEFRLNCSRDWNDTQSNTTNASANNTSNGNITVNNGSASNSSNNTNISTGPSNGSSNQTPKQNQSNGGASNTLPVSFPQSCAPALILPALAALIFASRHFPPKGKNQRF